MRISRRASCAFSIALASFLALSCDNSKAIFASVQDEIKQEGTKVFQKTQVKNAFRLGSRYYAATQSLNARDVGTKAWATVDIAGSSDYRLRSVVLTGNATAGTIYALIETGSTETPDISVYSSGDGTAWTAITPLPTLTCPRIRVSALTPSMPLALRSTPKGMSTTPLRKRAATPFITGT